MYCMRWIEVQVVLLYDYIMFPYGGGLVNCLFQAFSLQILMIVILQLRSNDTENAFRT